MENQTILRLSVMSEMLQDRAIKKVAEISGISKPTLYKIQQGDVNVKYETAEKLSDYLQYK
ncbi:MAG: hypothetical protein Unbinned4497contig1000_10 [Prokaryotic dsDNA virus sp.]|jgi:transcriptional regulator with XRE-family HTH domain|nr:MAG: hypothetical protein Unbinned4497contig1000_10 [Prokaryotic dsDNA virus sp.]|tara:strand:+ start:3068 stop:3250 length:183 start_codon:yes stop_codon:yes gene_type:complete